MATNYFSVQGRLILELNQIFQPDGGSIVSFISIDRLNAILAIAPTENYIKRTQTWVRRLDKTINADQRRLFVYFVNNGLADDLVKTLQGVFAANPNSPNPIERSNNQNSKSAPGNENTLISPSPKFWCHFYEPFLMNKHIIMHIFLRCLSYFLI